MRAHGGGVIVNTASEAGLVGVPTAGAYSAAKHAVIGMTKSAAGEYANMGIRINAVAPGAIATPMVVDLPQAGQDMLMAPQPLHRSRQPDQENGHPVTNTGNEDNGYHTECKNEHGGLTRASNAPAATHQVPW